MFDLLPPPLRSSTRVSLPWSRLPCGCHGALHSDRDADGERVRREGLRFGGGLYCGVMCQRKRQRKRFCGLDCWLPLLLVLLLLLLPLHAHFSHRGLQNPGRKAGPPSEIEKEGRGGGSRKKWLQERPFNERWKGKIKRGYVQIMA